MHDELGALVQLVKGEYLWGGKVASEKLERAILFLVHPTLTDESSQTSNYEECLWLIVKRLFTCGITNVIRECELSLYRLCRRCDRVPTSN